MSKDLVTVSDIRTMADAFTKSKLFGIQTVEQAMALLLIAQAEGNHPAIAVRDYHIIQGKPALKADAMLARFQAAGGKVEWIALTDEKVEAAFSHPQGGRAVIGWDLNRAKQAQLGSNGMWSKYPRQMLRARVISEGIRTVFPGVIVGSYTEEEVCDFSGTTIDVRSGEIEEKKNPFSVHGPEEMSQADKKVLYNEADEALDAVNDFDDLASWTDKYYHKLVKNIAAAHIKKIDAKAQSVQQALTDRENKGRV